MGNICGSIYWFIFTKSKLLDEPNIDLNLSESESHRDIQSVVGNISDTNQTKQSIGFNHKVKVENTDGRSISSTDHKQESCDEILLSSGHSRPDICEHLGPTSSCLICKQQLQSFELTEDNYTQELSKSVDDWPLGIQCVEPNRSMESCVYGRPEDSDWTPVTPEGLDCLKVVSNEELEICTKLEQHSTSAYYAKPNDLSPKNDQFQGNYPTLYTFK